LTQIPQAARQSDFADQLKRLGLEVSSKPTVLETIAAFTNAVDRYVRTRGTRSDLGEMAQHAAAETLTTLAGRELPSLFGPTAGDVQQAFAKLGSSDQFSILARDFFSRLNASRLSATVLACTPACQTQATSPGRGAEPGAAKAALAWTVACL